MIFTLFRRYCQANIITIVTPVKNNKPCIYTFEIKLKHTPTANKTNAILK